MKIWLVPLLLSLSACSDYNGDKALDKYQSRLANVLELQRANGSLTAPEALIPERDLKQALPDVRFNLTDAYASRRCGLDTLIGERNSSLGIVYTASKQLSYELRLLQKLEHCLTLSWDDSSLLNQLLQVYEQKQASVSIAFNNMLFTDNTLRKELLGIRKALPLKAAPGFTETWQALTELTLLQQFINEKNWQAASKVDIEQQLQLLYQYNFLARLQYSLRLTAHQLVQLNSLTQNQNSNTLCPNGRDSEQLRILANVFQKYFIGEIQLYSTELSRYQQQLWPLLQQLYQQTPLEQPLQQRFEYSYNSMRNELSQHVKWWQTLNGQCPLQLNGQK
ncbi:DUF3080 family protein [Rheinheimera sp. D18]|uniref:DUF3080 family protein n=1 Tax=Rheinheimera sp. D18 TaxID=2545632 RepID=UPI00104920EE|nr:DUF3080 family protein [Rheinheimera sp. D18]QBL09642.1 DUF3080 family protein [Rheinheimera sp. D18]